MEREYLSELKKMKLALYVEENESGEILERFSDYNVECLVNEKMTGKYIRGYYTVNFTQMLDLDIRHLILGVEIKNTGKAYNLIGALCKAYGIKVYNQFGMDMSALNAIVVKKYMDYPKLWEMDIKNAIDAHEVISFDIDNTVLTPANIYGNDFYAEAEKSLNAAGIHIESFADRMLELRHQKKYCSMKELLEELLENEKSYSPEEIWNVLLKKLRKSLSPRDAVVEVIQYALSAGKKVCFIEDMPEYRIPEDALMNILESYGITGYDSVICSTEYKMGKYDGLYSVIRKRYGDLACLHIGDEAEADLYMPQVHGMDIFLVKSPHELYRNLDPIAAISLENKNARALIEKYILDVYNDEYLMNKADHRKDAARDRAIQMENKIRFYQNCNEPIVYEPILFDSIEEEKALESYQKLQFSVYEEPKVSVIIPVYNQFGYTYNCLRAILEHSGNVAYEIIVADDCSTDHVRELEKIVKGITVLHNAENLRFLLNCNNAAKYAKGEYIVFLNNDTQVQPGWLEALVKLMDDHKDAGMAGSKLVYPEGYLQEAGGILWKDGSAWNYGNLKDPEDPEYSYVKEADYISGAAIMIRTALWKEIGGFDTTFAPAYYEDTDLAFEVRKHGYKVLFQPKSVVVHFEGISNGTDIAAGLKSYQAVNQQKFYRKWKEVLERDHFKNGEEVYLAKDRGQMKKQILVVDHYVPNYDKDAGGRCTYMYMKAFINLGMKVTFIGDNFAKPEPYTSVLTQLGVEVLYGNYYYNNWKEWLKENLKYFDYVYLQRPHISVKYMDIVKEYGRGKVFYFAHDLHYVRLYRDYLVTGNKESLVESEKWKKVEMELFGKTDVGHVVGSHEQKIVQEAFPEKPIRNIPLYIYDDIPEGIEKDFSKRKDIMFVGGFNHLPNVDAVLWFANEIYPAILESYPEMVWHIVGSNAPEEILELAGDHIKLEGFLSDEELEKLYRTCRLVVVPLRYGAGVKGKIVEAAYYQIPVVTTSIGGEGLDENAGAFVMEDDAARMAGMVNDLYEDIDKLREMSDAGERFVQTYFTSEAAKRVLLEDMNI